MKNFNTGTPVESGIYIIFDIAKNLYEIIHVSIEDGCLFIYDYPNQNASISTCPDDDFWKKVKWQKLG